VRDTKEIARLQALIQTQTEAIAFFERQATGQIQTQSNILGMNAFQEERRVAAMKDGLATLTRTKQMMQEMFAEGKSLGGIEGGAKKDATVFAEGLKGADFQGQLEKVRLKEFLPSDDDIRQLGISVGRQLAFGLMEGFSSMQDVLKAIFMSVMDFALGALLNSILPGAGLIGATKSVAGVPKVSGSVVGPAQMSLQLPAMQPLTAYALARDPAYQAL